MPMQYYSVARRYPQNHSDKAFMFILQKISCEMWEQHLGQNPDHGAKWKVEEKIATEKTNGLELSQLNF